MLSRKIKVALLILVVLLVLVFFGVAGIFLGYNYVISQEERFANLKASIEDGTFEITLASTDYNLLPYNAVLDGWPFNGLETSPQGLYAIPTIKRGVKITAKFGWASVPKTINTACIIQSERLFKRFDAPLGIAGTNALGQAVLVKPELDEDVKALLTPYRRTV